MTIYQMLLRPYQVLVTTISMINSYIQVLMDKSLNVELTHLRLATLQNISSKVKCKTDNSLFIEFNVYIVDLNLILTHVLQIKLIHHIGIS